MSASVEAVDASTKMLDAVNALKSRASGRIAVALASIETDGGKLVSSANNIALVSQLIAQMKGELIDDEFLDAVADYIETMDGISDGAVEAFSEFDGVDQEVVDAIKMRYKRSIAEELTDPSTYQDSVWNQVADNVVYGIAVGAALDATQSAVMETVVGSDLASSVTATVASAPMSLQRVTTAIVAEQVGAEFFLFQGRPIKTTRDWCLQREGKYWHIEEIRQWGRDAAAGNGWDGMVEGTNEQTIFVNLGGWYGSRGSCRHVLVPVPRFSVPKEDLDRMRAKGLIK